LEKSANFGEFVSFSNNLTVSAVILAAGLGKRMKSTMPKVLHQVCGRPMLEWILDALSTTSVSDICLVLGDNLVDFSNFLNKFPQTRVCIQKNRLGTGDAVAATAVCFDKVKTPRFSSGERLRGHMVKADYLLICAGDTPAITGETLEEFMTECLDSSSELGVLGMIVPNPQGYGRLVLDAKGQLQSIVEERDADAATKALKLCNSGVIFAKADLLFELLDGIKPQNAQGEYYLTDCFGAARQRGISVFVKASTSYQEFQGVNDPEQLKAVEHWMQEREAH
jgi:bifunctional UDP-N-acetylglucosamine pyrophosphorylase/glucosamine-1-phosphate N-acetyltransferase